MPSLTLTVLRCPEYGAAETRHVQGTSLVVGRGTESGWTLPDPLKSLSRRHCQLDCIGGVWQVRDLSSNGTFFNAATSAIGRDHAQPLADGDRLRLGDYEIEVRIREDAPATAAGVPPFGRGDAAAPAGPAARPGFGAARLPGLDDPVDVLSTGGAPAPGRMGAMPDHGPASAQAFPPPAVRPAPAPERPSERPSTRPSTRPVVPDDWYRAPASAGSAAPTADADRSGVDRIPTGFDPAADLGLSPVAPPPPEASPAATSADAPWPVEAPAASERPPAPSAPPSEAVSRAAPVAPAATGSPGPGAAASALTALMAGANQSPEAALRTGGDPDAILRTAGALLSEAVGGLRALLIARGTVKREFRIEQTMLQPRENNPLKFAATDEQALAALLDPRAPSLEAVREAIGDLTAHQVAVLAATQAAARALLERLDPADLEAEDTGRGLFDAREKRLWEAYKRRHAQLTDQFDDDFESAFGKAFARAYEGAVGKGRP